MSGVLRGSDLGLPEDCPAPSCLGNRQGRVRYKAPFLRPFHKSFQVAIGIPHAAGLQPTGEFVEHGLASVPAGECGDQGKRKSRFDPRGKDEFFGWRRRWIGARGDGRHGDKFML